MSRPECRDLRERLSAFLDGELPPREAETVRAHIEGCDDCRRELEALRAADALFRQASPPDPGDLYAREFLPRLHARIAEEEEAEFGVAAMAAASARPGDEERESVRAGEASARASSGREAPGRGERKRASWWFLPWSPSLGTTIGGLAVAAIVIMLFLARDLPFSPGEPWRLREERTRSNETMPVTEAMRSPAVETEEGEADDLAAQQPVEGKMRATSPTASGRGAADRGGVLEMTKREAPAKVPPEPQQGLRSPGYADSDRPQAAAPMEEIAAAELTPEEAARQALGLLAAIDRDVAGRQRRAAGADADGAVEKAAPRAATQFVDRDLSDGEESLSITQLPSDPDLAYRALLPLLQAAAASPLPDSLAREVEAALGRVSALVAGEAAGKAASTAAEE